MDSATLLLANSTSSLVYPLLSTASPKAVRSALFTTSSQKKISSARRRKWFVYFFRRSWLDLLAISLPSWGFRCPRSICVVSRKMWTPFGSFFYPSKSHGLLQIWPYFSRRSEVSIFLNTPRPNFNRSSKHLNTVLHLYCWPQVQHLQKKSQNRLSKPSLKSWPFEVKQRS